MKISVVVSTYNGELYISELLESLYCQKRLPDEVLFFDDCSSDNTCQIVNNFIVERQLSPKWKLIINSENKGWEKNFIEGLWTASGDIILPCDQDDIWLDNKILEIEKIFSENENILLLTTNCIAFYEDGKELIRPNKEDKRLNKEPPHMDFFEVKYPGCTYAVKRSLVIESKKYWEKDFPHDALLWRMAVYLDGAYSYNKSLIRWRKHNDSTFTKESISGKTFEAKRKWLEYAERSLNSVERIISCHDVDNDLQKRNILKSNMNAIQARIQFYDSPSVIKAIMLLKYYRQYARKRQILGDWYIVFLKK